MPTPLNYKHLHYFWLIAHEGSIVRAAERLHLAPQTLSGQLTQFEESLGGLLFRRQGRKLVLTDLGRLVLHYADGMFELAQELRDALQGAAEHRPIELRVGVSASIHKLIAHRMIQPALTLGIPIQLSCMTSYPADLEQALQENRLDVAVVDAPSRTQGRGRLHSHELGASPISFFAAPPLAEALSTAFPGSLQEQPFLLSGADNPVNERVIAWLQNQGIRIRPVAWIDDSALLKVFARQGLGVFVAPTLIRDEVCRQYDVLEIGHTDQVTDHYYALTASTAIQHLAVRAICRLPSQDHRKNR